MTDMFRFLSLSFVLNKNFHNIEIQSIQYNKVINGS